MSKEFESENLNELFAALVKAQQQMQIAKTDSTNPHYKSKYADLESIVTASRDALVANNLAVMQRIIETDTGKYLLSRLCHASGQWIESKVTLRPLKDDIQSLGSYITYMRRYTYAALIGVVTGEGKDDDGEAAVQKKTINSDEANERHISTLTIDEVIEIDRLIGGDTELLERILKTHNKKRLSEISKDKYFALTEWLKTRTKQ